MNPQAQVRGRGWKPEISRANNDIIPSGKGFIGGVCQGKGLLSSAQTFKQQQQQGKNTKGRYFSLCTHVKQQQETLYVKGRLPFSSPRTHSAPCGDPCG